METFAFFQQMTNSVWRSVRREPGATKGALILWLAAILLGPPGIMSGVTAAKVAVSQTPTAKRPTARDYALLPMSFEPNVGQAEAPVQFISRGQGYTFFLSSTEAVVVLNSEAATMRGGSASPPVIRLHFAGANTHASAEGLDVLPGHSNYFLGSDPARWRTGIPQFARVRVRGVYPGVDLVFYGGGSHSNAPGKVSRLLEWDLMAAPCADLAKARFNVTVDGKPAHLRLAHNGDLLLMTSAGEVRLRRPSVYQPAQDLILAESGATPARARSVASRYRLLADGTVAFSLEGYDPAKPVVIDPAILYATYLGGSAGDQALGLAVDGNGNAYVTGLTNSTNFPTQGPYQAANGGQADAFVTKIAPGGNSLVYSTYLGGSSFDKGTGIAVDASGNAYVTGYTSSNNFPTTTGVFQTAYGGNGNAFVAKLNPAGAQLVYSTYLGGSGGDFGQGIAIDSAGDAYVTGSTQSTNFPVANAYQGTNKGGSDAFVSELNPTGVSLVFSTYAGGSAADAAQAIALDSSGNVFVAGYTYSTDFPTASAYQAQNAGQADAFLLELKPSGAGLVFSTYLGGSGVDRAFGLALDSSDNVYLAGDTQSTDFPVTSSALQAANAGQDDGFVVKFNAGGGSLAYSTYLGGSGTDQANDIALDGSGNAYVTGFTQSSDFPLMTPFQATFGGGTCAVGSCPDAFVTKLNASGGMVYSSYLGGSSADYGQAVQVDSSGDAYVAGSTVSTNFPTVAGGAQAAFGGTASFGNGFVAKVTAADQSALSTNPLALSFGNQDQNLASTAQTILLTDAGSQPITITGISTNGDFSQTNTCTAPLAAAGGTCTINVTFTPTTVASLTGTLVISSNAPGSPLSVQLSGAGVTATPAVTLNPTTLTFPDTLAGSTSAPLTATLTNTGGAPLTISKIAVTGDYSEMDNCPLTTSLAAGASCVLSVTFKPAKSGADNSSVTITANTTPATTTLAVNGTGLPVFTVSLPTPTQTAVIGSQSVTFTAKVTGPSSFTSSIALTCSGSSASCTASPASVTVGNTSTFTVNSFNSSTPNPLVLTVTGTAGSQTSTATDTITFSDFKVAASPTLDNIVAGQAATYNLTVTPLNGFSQTVALACSGAPTLATCTVSPTSVTLNGTTPAVAVYTVQTAAHTGPGGMSLGRRGGPFGGNRNRLWLMAVSCLLLLWLAMQPRRRPVWLLAVLLGLLAISMGSCNNYYGGFIGGNPAPSGTPSGVYTVTFTGTFTPSSTSGSTTTSSAISRTATVNLAVQ
jgi:hypothetical protein